MENQQYELDMYMAGQVEIPNVNKQPLCKHRSSPLTCDQFLNTGNEYRDLYSANCNPLLHISMTSFHVSLPQHPISS